VIVSTSLHSGRRQVKAIYRRGNWAVIPSQRVQGEAENSFMVMNVPTGLVTNAELCWTSDAAITLCRELDQRWPGAGSGYAFDDAGWLTKELSDWCDAWELEHAADAQMAPVYARAKL